MSMHSTWYRCLHAGSRRTASPPCTAPRHTEHSPPPPCLADPGVRELRDLGRHVSDATQYVVLSPRGTAGARGGYDWRTPPDVAVAVEDDDGDERDAREADAGVAEDGRPFANGLVLLRHRRRHTHRRRAGTRTHGDGDGDGNGGDLSFVRGGMSRGIG
ncbi:hypothetical protein OsJ_21602 [Oryza sativa Japonica Group]|uniref:Uncharacterized protein n=1 Tax=Oryza sativa subsp. japonica TaxID=39947 RepID=A3BCH5_ORYSJ|nr:hypothetical protein OsJ_21602 [Oryza sativa Japonica Group]